MVYLFIYLFIYLYVAGIIFWCTQTKIELGCLRVRPDANAEADTNRSKTICRPPLKGVDIINLQVGLLIAHRNHITPDIQLYNESIFSGLKGVHEV